MMIKTVWNVNPGGFDNEVNQLFDDGWRLMKREILTAKPLDDSVFYAELVKVDEAPAPDPLEALRVVRDFCEEMATEKCLGKCPLTPWCAMYCPQDGMAPADWVIPDEEVDA